MDVFQTALIISAFLCSLVAGFLFAYAIVVMPGIKSLNDREFVRAFQVTDGVIQDNPPVFLLVWIGSAIAIIVAGFYGIGLLQGIDLYLLMFTTLVYILGVQVLTVAIHLPLNNRLQTLKLDAMSEDDIKVARNEFESRWNQYNRLRTVIACFVSLSLIILLLRL